MTTHARVVAMRSPQAFALGFGDFARLSVRAIFFFNFAQGDDNDKARAQKRLGAQGFRVFVLACSRLWRLVGAEGVSVLIILETLRMYES